MQNAKTAVQAMIPTSIARRSQSDFFFSGTCLVITGDSCRDGIGVGVLVPLADMNLIFNGLIVDYNWQFDKFTITEKHRRHMLLVVEPAAGQLGE